MSNETNTPEQPSTPQQAEELFHTLAELTAMNGIQYSHASTFGEKVVKVPDSIAEHFPAVEEDSDNASRTLYVSQELDHTNGQPRKTGVVGIVTFIQKEKRDADLGYATNVNYHVISDDGESYRLERHVTSNEFGKAAVAKYAAERAFAHSNPREAAERQLAELTALRDKVTETRNTEAEMGLPTVTNNEAQAILDTLGSFKSQPA